MPEPTPLPIPSAARGAAHDRDVCAVCRSPLSPETRYCLQCGARRADARLEFLDVLDEHPGRAPAPSIATATTAASMPPSRFDALRGWPFGLTATVLLALLIGLVAGRWLGDKDDNSATPATQVIRVEGAAGTAVPTAGVAPTTAAPAGTAATTTKAKATKQGDTSVTAPKKITRDSEKKALDDTSGNENLAPKDDDPDGANFDEIK